MPVASGLVFITPEDMMLVDVRICNGRILRLDIFLSYHPLPFRSLDALL